MRNLLKNSFYIVATLITCLFKLDAYSQSEHPELYPRDSIVSRFHNDWTQRHYRKRIEEFIKQPLDTNQIVFVGNSITEQGRDWSEKFGIANIRNRGISGDITDGVLRRLDEITFYKPKAVFLLIGVNDLFNLHHEEDKRSTLKYDLIVPSVEYVANNILNIVKSIKRKSPETVVFVRTVLPANRPYLKDDIVKLNNLISRNESKGYYLVLDLYKEFADANGDMTQEYTTDGVHLNDAGYARWVEFEKPFVELYK